jgi:hypothetical protein
MISSDKESLNQLLSDNLAFTNHFGSILSKSEDVAAHKLPPITFADLLI